MLSCKRRKKLFVAHIRKQENEKKKIISIDK